MKFYLASPLFTDYEKSIVKTSAKFLRDKGYEVYVPMEHQIEDAWTLPNHIWGRKVFEEDIKAIRECDAVVCIYYGLYSDSGTAWECGFAYGINKPIQLIDCSGKEVSLMVVNGATNFLDFVKKNQA